MSIFKCKQNKERFIKDETEGLICIFSSLKDSRIEDNPDYKLQMI